MRRTRAEVYGEDKALEQTAVEFAAYAARLDLGDLGLVEDVT